MMSVLSRMETLCTRLELHNRLLGSAIEEASEIPAAASLEAVNDGLCALVIQYEQLKEMGQLVEDAHAALRAFRPAAFAMSPRQGTIALVPGTAAD